MKSKNRLTRTILLATFLALFVIGLDFVQAQKAEDFERLSDEIEAMHVKGLFTGGKTWETLGLTPPEDGDEIPAGIEELVQGKGEPVQFDDEEARTLGFSNDVIQIAQEMASLSNHLTASLSENNPSIEEVEVDWSKYRYLAKYFEDAKQYNGADKVEAQSIGYGICGYYWNPKPSAAAPWQTSYSSNPSATLTSWGFHPTLGLAGGGWTRPQTYSWAYCGWNTYRDHAYTVGSSTIRLQDYTSFPGEPNPEVYASGPWPYADWPAYVFWWHNTY